MAYPHDRPVMRHILRATLGPLARTYLRVRLRRMRLDDVAVFVVGAHKLGHLALEPLVSFLGDEPSDGVHSARSAARLWNLGRLNRSANREMWLTWKRELPCAPSRVLSLAVRPKGPTARPAAFYPPDNLLDRNTWRPSVPLHIARRTEEFLSDLGVSPNRPIVALVINEGVHYGDSWILRETELDPALRLLTFDPGAFAETVRSLIEDGQVVVRLGRHSAARIEVSDPSFIDYAHHPLRCDALDVGLAARARLILSTQTGPDSVALAFGRPVTYFDVARLKYAFFDVASVHWQPAVLINSHGEKLSLSRQLADGVLALKTPDDFARRGIRVLRSEPAEYVHVAREGLAIASGSNLLRGEDAELQARARAIIGRATASGAIERRGRPSAIVSPRFLRMNPWWLEDSDG